VILNDLKGTGGQLRLVMLVVGVLAFAAAAAAPSEQQASAIRDCVKTSTTPEQAIVLARWLLLENYSSEAGFSDLFVTPDAARQMALTEAATVAGIVLGERCAEPIRRASANRQGGSALGTAFSELIAQAARARPSQANTERSMRQALALVGALPDAPRRTLERATNMTFEQDAGQGRSTSAARTAAGASDPVAASFAPGTGVECAYPPDARRLNEEGTVVVVFYVDAAGRPSDLSIETSSGSTRLDDAAIYCLSRAKYRPAMPNGVATGAYQRIRWTWRLDN
jgi:TonB family protein